MVHITLCIYNLTPFKVNRPYCSATVMYHGVTLYHHTMQRHTQYDRLSQQQPAGLLVFCYNLLLTKRDAVLDCLRPQGPKKSNCGLVLGLEDH